MYKTVEFNMIYALMSIISFVAIYALLGGPALTINSWLGDQNQFIQPGSGRSRRECDEVEGSRQGEGLLPLPHLHHYHHHQTGGGEAEGEGIDFLASVAEAMEALTSIPAQWTSYV